MQGLFIALHGQPERTALTRFKRVGIADGVAAKESGIQFAAADAQLIWRVCRLESIGAGPDLLDDRRYPDEEGSRYRIELAKREEATKSGPESGLTALSR